MSLPLLHHYRNLSSFAVSYGGTERDYPTTQGESLLMNAADRQPAPIVSSPTQDLHISPQARPRMVTARAVITALLLLPFNTYWVVMMEVTRYAGHPTTISLFFNVIFLLAVLIGLN